MANAEVIAKIFSKIDTDNSGSICESELNSAFKDFDQDGKFLLDIMYNRQTPGPVKKYPGVL